MKSLPNITRCKGKRGDGWQVRFYRESKWFSASKYGGVRKALAAAIAYRDQRKAELETMRENYRGVLTYPRGSTPYVGVSYEKKKHIRGHTVENFIASWSEDGKVRRKFFSIRKYGYEEALKLALQARGEGAGYHPDYNYG